MHSQKLGSSFEIITEKFFIYLFDLVGFQINNNWIQKGGTQNGFDVGFQIAINNDVYFKRDIYIECKNYKKSKLDKTSLHGKLMELSFSNFNLNNAIYFFLSPRVNLKSISQDSNPKFLEDYFNKQFGFKTIILTPNNRIKEVLSLNEEIFKEVYYDEDFYELDQIAKEDIINYFKNLFISKGEIPNFKKLSVKKSYLNEASVDLTEYYLPRKLYNSNFEEFNILNTIKINDFIVLLGEPGSGKSTELKNTVKYFENKISEYGITPIFINLSTFNNIDSVMDLLPKNWKFNDKVLLVLDSFDEFILKDELTKMLLEISNNKDVNLKIIVGCRTYAYKDEFKILNQEKYYLESITREEVRLFFEKKYNIEAKNIDEILKALDDKIITDLYFMDLIGKYFRNKKQSLSISNIYKSIFLDNLSEEIIYNYNLLGFIFEMSDLNIINQKQLKKLFGLKYLNVINEKIFEKSFDGINYKFSHKSCQEFFAANFISKLDFEKIKEIILINETNKIHPKLFNTVTFLFNLIDANSQISLINWIVQNQPEIIFRADKNRISKFSQKIFQDYFINHCINKTYWITTNSPFTVKEIASFAESLENYIFLINQINENKHSRIVVSAIEIISFFNLKSLGRVEVTKKLFNDILKKIEYSDGVKSSVINCMSLQLFTKYDIPFLDSILSIFKNSSNKEINRALLSLLLEQESTDKYFDFIFEEFLYENKIKERELEDNVMRGTNYVLTKLILKLENSENFIQFAKYFFDNEYRFYVSSDDLNDIVEKALEYQKNDSKFIVSLLENMNIKKINFFFENSLNYLIANSTKESKTEVINYLLSKSNFKDVSYQLSILVDNDTIKLVIEFLKDKLETEQKEIEFFRNRLSNKENRTVGKFFNEKMEELGYVFTENWYSDYKIKKAREDFKNKPQENFNLLFDKSKLLERINKIFKNSSEELDLQMYHTIEKEWYEENGHWQRIDSSYEIIRTILINIREKLNYDELTSYIDDDFLINEIISDIENFSKNEEIKVEQYQLEYITNWINKRENEIDFDSIIKYNNYDRFSLLKDYKSWENIIFFARKFDVVLSDDFMLKSLNISYVRNFNEDESLFIFLSNKISNTVALTQKIVQNLQEKKFNSFIGIEHLKYVLENYIEESYSDVRSLLLEEKIEHNLIEILKKFYESTKDISFLKECTGNLETQKAWDAIILILEYKLDNKFVEEKALSYLNDIDETAIKNYLSNGLHVLFKLNKPSALKFYMKHMEDEYNNSLRFDYYGDFNAVVDYQDLIILFDKIYLNESFERSFNSAQNILKQCVTNLSSSEDTYPRIHDLLINKRDELKRLKQDNGIFYINLLIDLSENSYYNSKSKPLNFEDALKKAEEILR